MIDLSSSLENYKAWITIQDLSPEILINYQRKIKYLKIVDEFILPDPEEGRIYQNRKKKNEEKLAITKDELNKWEGYIPIPHFFLLADEEGVAIYLHCQSEVGEPLRKAGLREGVHFSLGCMGINGISMAMEHQTIVAVRGHEHDHELLRSLNCLCVPIRWADGTTAGYLDMSFSVQYEIEFAIPILMQILDRIERRLNNEGSEHSRQRLEEALDRYKLTPREKEAAYGWMRNYSALRIAEEMGITEGTVRNLIKKVYAKTNCRSRGAFIQAVGQWI